MFILDKKTIFLLIGFVILLVSIPLGSLMLTQSTIFKSRASGPEKTASSSAKIAPVKSNPVPSNSPLLDLQKLVTESTSSSPLVTEATPTPTTAPAVNLAFGPTLSFKVSLDGRPANNQATKLFIGIASGSLTTKPSYVLTFTIDVPTSGIFNGLSLAGLNPGSNYTAYIKGSAQIDAASTFIMSPTESNLNNNQAITLLSGDLNDDNTINSSDYNIAKNLYGSTSSSSNWNSRADLNTDGVINNIDLSIINKNLGKTGASSIWYSPPPTATASASLNTSGSSSQTGGFWLWIPPEE